MKNSYKKLVNDLYQIKGNNRCVDCGTKDPKWVSLYYGTFICLDCAGFHRSLGVYLDNVRSVTLDSWDEKMYLAMKYGGNDKFRRYLNERGIEGGGMEGNEMEDGDMRRGSATTSREVKETSNSGIKVKETSNSGIKVKETSNSGIKVKETSKGSREVKNGTMSNPPATKYTEEIYKTPEVIKYSEELSEEVKHETGEVIKHAEINKIKMKEYNRTSSFINSNAKGSVNIGKGSVNIGTGTDAMMKEGAKKGNDFKGTISRHAKNIKDYGMKIGSQVAFHTKKLISSSTEAISNIRKKDNTKKYDDNIYYKQSGGSSKKEDWS